jgi:uncharacterized protein YbaA (DUF1428 family)
MYQELFVYRVPTNRTEDFERVVGQAIAVFQRHGALGGELTKVADDTAKFGCLSMGGTVGAKPTEVVYLETSYFHDKAHYELVNAAAEADPEVVDLFDVLTKTISIEQVVRSEFQTVMREVDHTAMAAHSVVGHPNA